VTVRGGGLEAWLGIRPTAAWVIPPPQNIPKRILYQERWQSDGHPLVKGGPTFSQIIFLFLSLASLVMRCFNFNRPPALYRLMGKTIKEKKSSYGLFHFRKSLYGPDVWVFTLSRYRADGLLPYADYGSFDRNVGDWDLGRRVWGSRVAAYLNPSPYILHPTPYTLRPTICPVQPEPLILNPKP
jgi:hypothetical protein